MLLDQEHAELVADTLAEAELVFASDLTLIECDRVLIIDRRDRLRNQAFFSGVAPSTSSSGA